MISTVMMRQLAARSNLKTDREHEDRQAQQCSEIIEWLEVMGKTQVSAEIRQPSRSVSSLRADGTLSSQKSGK